VTEPDWHTVKEIAALRSWLSERWLRRLVAERRVRFTKVGGKLLVDLNDLDQYVANGTIEPDRRGRRP
jgi:excisionase family DNA binding protein